ncbi:uncharacterized protein LOC144176013 isoform X4 [Haemaphysalis longicornis]
MVTRQAWEQGEGTISQWDAHPHSGHLYCACASLFPGCCQATAPISLAVRSVLSSWWLVQSEGPPAVLLLPGLLPEWWPLACAPLGHRQLRSNCNPPFGDIGSIALRTGRAGRESRPFTCHFCPYAASLKHHLTRHLRRHTGKKPFQCAVCPAAFIRKDHLGIHMRKHTGEKPYRCTLCALAFSHRRSLVSHMQAHQAPPAYY